MYTRWTLHEAAEAVNGDVGTATENPQDESLWKSLNKNQNT